MTPRKYMTPVAFKQAVEQRLRSASATGTDFARRRQMLIFDRFLARVIRVVGDTATLKGGLALELRLERTRTTRDVDLRFMGSPHDVLARLQEGGRLDLADYMTFEVQPNARHPEIQNDGMKYDGLRFQAQCKLGGKLFGQVFGVDVAFGDPMLGQPEEVVAKDFLGFAGIEPPRLRIYPIETHIAEKLHAYTMPRARPNTRVKDLPDLALLAMTGEIDAIRVRMAFDQTFSYRDTHAPPGALPIPPASWEAPYAEIAREDALRWATLVEVEEAVRAFLDPVLAGELRATWTPVSWKWRRE